jgi:ubiquinone/menaquinone biosynthesis C-methylase UbiE
MPTTPKGAGKSSYELIEPNLVFERLALEKHTAFLDVACGFGKYAIAAADIMSDNGIVYAIDLWPAGITALQQEALEKKIGNIWSSVGDVSRRLPLEDNSIDVCLMATVLHDLVETGKEKPVLQEINRVLGPGGELIVIEFEKIEGPPGPPMGIRLSDEQVEEIVTPFGFRAKEGISIGKFNYLISFTHDSDSIGTES